ncbi:MAG: type II toxin-antitoxin system VapC family toxin [Gammaproteobacteria bacterium]|nr:type II toxin-antitoxin system VapC family toxin [Gammaproteobacteria bacterium]
MIYLDTSVLLAWLLAEDRRPDDTLWTQTLVASRLLEYEVWTRLHARNLSDSLGESARDLLGRVAFVELAPRVLGRALEGFPLPVRTLDALHLASFSFLLESGQAPRLASYDRRMLDVAQALEWPLAALENSP